MTKVQDTINLVLNDSGRLFKEGLLAFKDNRHSDAGEKFNKSVEVFLYSTLNIQKDQRLQACYNQLIEVVYRIEFPFRTQNPQMEKLALTCGWKWDEKDIQIADSIAKNVENLAAKQIPISEEKAREFIERQNSVKEVVNKARLDVEAAKSDLLSILVRQNKGESLDAEYKNAQANLTNATNKYVEATQKLNKISLDVKSDPVAAFSDQQFEPSPLDELSKLELVLEEPKIPLDIKGETWQTISNRTGVSVAELKAANPGMTVPKERVFVPIKGRNVTATSYARPAPPIMTSNGVKVVKAQAGDTISKLAARYGANATEVAKFNGLLVNSVLSAGREIKIPSRSPAAVAERTVEESKPVQMISIGSKPAQGKDGKVAVVMNYFNETLHDPYSARFVRWSPLSQISYAGAPYWAVTVKYRAKNTMGAYVLSEQTFYIRHNKVIFSR
jgi:LysM repeat protein